MNSNIDEINNIIEKKENIKKEGEELIMGLRFPLDKLYEKMMSKVCEDSSCRETRWLNKNYKIEIDNICGSFKALIEKITQDALLTKTDREKDILIGQLKIEQEILKDKYKKIETENEENKTMIKTYFVPRLNKDHYRKHSNNIEYLNKQEEKI